MRCYCCNNILTTQESNRKFTLSQGYTEMCNVCLNTIDVETSEGESYREEEELYDEDGNPQEV